MSVKIILDPGSCHLGNLEYAKELIKIAADCGADACKFQLFKNLSNNGNIELNRKWFPELVECGKDFGIEVFASAFDTGAIQTLMDCGCKSIKIPYSLNETAMASYMNQMAGNSTFYISGDTMTDWGVSNGFPKIKLYCIPQYPVKYLIDFNGIFPRFDGFSDHTLGYTQTLNAVYEGAKVIEKHFRLDTSKCDTVPDGKFALYPREVEKMCKLIRGY